MVTETELKLAAIWARVSTDKQAETSIPTQVDLSKKKAESLGYTVPKDFILTTDRTSLQLNDDPKFLQLYDLIRKQTIKAIFLLDRDRLQAEPLERLFFIDSCKDNGVQIIPCQGPELLDSDEGQLIEMALAYGKKKSVLRAQLGSKQGLHDRVARDRLPVTYHKMYGYTWQKPSTLLPNEEWNAVKLIFNLLLQGNGYEHIIKELHLRGIASPSGQPRWNKSGLSQLVHNPAYAGRYYALKEQSVIPKKRRGNTYGKSSYAPKPQNEWVYLPEIKIENPPITIEQHHKIIDQIKSHINLSKRHANHDYLLRGFVFCREHYAKNGRPRTYHGHPKRDMYYYCCPVPGCHQRYIPGPKLDEYAKAIVTKAFKMTDREFYKSLDADSEVTKEQIEHELNSLTKKANRITETQAKLEYDNYAGKHSPEVYSKLRERLRLELEGINTQRDKLLDDMAQVTKRDEIKQSLEELRTKFLKKMLAFRRKESPLGMEPLTHVEETELSVADWREIFAGVKLEIRPRAEDEQEKMIAKFPCFYDFQREKLREKVKKYDGIVAMGINIEVKLNIPLSDKKLQEVVKSIAFVNPALSKPNKDFSLILSPSILAACP